MKTFRLPPLASLALPLALLAAASAGAQEVVQALPGTTDADALAADMRQLASNPRDVQTLVEAAHLSLKLDDMSGAAALLQRAENVDPRNPRVKAGQASVLVESERPGQALRYFAEAEAQGLDPATFAAERGLAYDLTGQQERAQRDYARALRDHPEDEETIRRYALSLGISGQRQRALQLLDPLVRRSDRAAWRAQAFVLAMTGDIGGAARIAATMMPGGATGLSAFFERLPSLPATDRAFAVHFGEVRATPERLADARLAPPLGPLPRELGVALASAHPLPAPPARGRRDRGSQPPAVAVAPVVVAAAAPPPHREPIAPAPSVVVRSTPPASAAAVPTVPPVVLAAVAPQRVPILAAAREPAGTVVSATMLLPAQVQVAGAPPAAPAASPAAVLPPASQPAPAVVSALPSQLAAALPMAGSVGVSPVSPATVTPTPTPRPTPITAAPQAVQVVALPPSAPLAGVERPAIPARSPATPRASEDSILARIIANLSIPGSELGVGEPERAVPPGVEPAPTEPAHVEPVAVVKTDTSAADKAVADKLAVAKAAIDRKAAAAKAAADKKALAEKKAAAEKKALADKEAAEQKKAERANPERIWVQVAGGASERDLPKAFASVKARAPGVFGSRQGWTTPLRATNRVLAGPFKTDDEARQFVNDLKKEGVGAFTFTSDVGQPVSRLGAKGRADDDEPAAKPPSKKSDTKDSGAKNKRRR